MLEFDWDEENLKHIARHGVTPEEVEFVLGRPTLDIGYQDWHGEERSSEVGAAPSGRILTVITTFRGHRIRVVTAYDASKREAGRYFRLTVN